MTTNMWSTPEANAWSRDFNYDDYTTLYYLAFPKGTPFKEKHYKMFCDVFHSVMASSQKNIPEESDE